MATIIPKSGKEGESHRREVALEYNYKALERGRLVDRHFYPVSGLGPVPGNSARNAGLFTDQDGWTDDVLS